MHTFYFPGHIRHDPAQLSEPNTPLPAQRFHDPAERGSMIHEAVKTANLGPITEPADFSIDPIGEIHEYGFLNLLQNAHERMANEESSQLALPYTFLKNQIGPHRPRSVWGQLGYYAYDGASPILEHTWDVAYWNAQVAVSAAALINAQGEQIAYALCRPPGHHAGPNFFGGACYLNNTAVAAQWLVQQGKRVAILDLDYFHGNGTQAIFYGRSNVLFCSIHADPLYEYPYFWGYADEYGVGGGKGYNFNYPLPRRADTDDYLAALDNALDRIRLYVPDLLLISLGVNFIQDDPANKFQIPAHTLTTIGQTLAKINLPTVVVQEGGTMRDGLGRDVVTFLTALQGDANKTD